MRNDRKTRPAAISPRRFAFAALLLLVYAAPLFWPPGPVHPETVTARSSWLLARLFPGVSPLWVAVRLVALAVGAVLLAGHSTTLLRSPFQPLPSDRDRPGIRALRWLALGVAVLHASSAPWAFRLRPAGQAAYLLLLVVPALLLAWPTSWAVRLRPARLRRGALPATVILVWIGLRLVGDLHSPRVADTVDGWQGFVATLRFVPECANVLTELMDPTLPGLGALPLFFTGLPLFHSGVVPPSYYWVQVLQIFWLAATAAGVGLLARTVVGRGTALIAVAVFLFAPYTRLMSLSPVPFLIGPVYTTAIALCALTACRRRSEAALAMLGALSGIALTYPGAVPTVALLGALTVWHLRSSWRSLWLGWTAALASFTAAVVPALPNVLTPARMAVHFRWAGVVGLLDGTLLGQLPLGSFAAMRDLIPPRPFDIVAAAFIAPFAHPRISVRLWGDTIFDPVGAALMAIGLVSCLRAARRSSSARFLLLFLLIALSPAFVSPVSVVDIVHAVVLPVPAALLAAAGFAVLQGHLGWKRGRMRAAAVAAAAICIGGTVIFDVVNPRILSASSFGIMFRVLQSDAADRAVVLDYSKRTAAKQWLFTEPIAAFAGPRPVRYLEYGDGRAPVADLTAEGKDIIFWSPGLEADVRVTRAVCAQWPAASLFEIRDEAGLGRVYAARIGRAGWEPAGPTDRWRRWDCASGATPPSPAP